MNRLEDLESAAASTGSGDRKPLDDAATELRPARPQSPDGAPAVAVDAGLSRGIVILLAAAILINYVDRGNLATAAPLMQSELKLTNAQIGMLLSAFFWVYAPMQLVAGWMAERFNLTRLLALGLALWSLATLATGLVTSFAAILLLRLVLGLGESAFFPCSSKLLALRAGKHDRAAANGLIAAGMALGPTVGTLAGGLLMASFGWRAVMVAFGAVSLSWLWPWLAATRREPSVARAAALHPVSYAEILRQRSVWGASLGHFCSNYVLYFVLTWLPSYLVKARGFSMTEMATLGSFVYCLYAFSCTATGWTADRLVRGGASPNRVYKTFIVAASLGSAVCMLLCVSTAPSLSVLWLAAAGIFFGFGSSMIFLIAQTLAGPRATGQWVGIQNFIGNFAGMLAPWLTGLILDRTGGFDWAFALAGLVALCGAVAWGIVIPRVETLRWREFAAQPT
jgi:MFS family permease